MSLFLVCNKTEERETVLIKKTATLSIAVICGQYSELTITSSPYAPALGNGL